MLNLFENIQKLISNGEHCCLCTITATKGSTPLKTGAKMVVSQTGKILGTIGGGDLEREVIANALNVIKTGTSKSYTHNLLQQHGMCCGGIVEVFIDFISKPERLYIFGAGHVGRALARVATTVGFDVIIIDERKKELDLLEPNIASKLPLHYKDLVPTLPFDKNTYIAVMTRDHSMDREILSMCIHRDFAYLGMIGSMRKIEITKKMFVTGGICTVEEFGKIDSPMGVDIKAHSPEEIAISILAKLISVKNIKYQRTNKSEKLSEYNI